MRLLPVVSRVVAQHFLEKKGQAIDAYYLLLDNTNNLVQQGIVLTGVDADWFQVILGGLLLVAVLFNEGARRGIAPFTTCCSAARGPR